MKTEVGWHAAPSLRWLAAFIIPSAAIFHFLAASESDYLPDDGERFVVPFNLGAKGERQAEAMAHFITGLLREESEGPERALDSYRKVLALDPGYTRLAIEVAYDSLRRGEATKAIGFLKDAIKAKPEAAEASLALSSIYLRYLHKPDLATRYAEAALKANSSRFAAYEALWEIAQTQGDAANGEKVLDRAVRAKTSNTGFWLQLADFLTNSSNGGLLEDSKTASRLAICLDKAAQNAGNNGEALARIADFHALNRQYAQAVRYYQKAAELKPQLPNIYERLAGTLIELGRKNDAIPVLEKVIAGNPLSLPAYDQLYQIYEERGDHEKALRSVEQALIIDKAHYGRQRDLMYLLLRTGRIDEAVQRAGDARKIFPQVPLFTCIQARALAWAKRNDEALRMFEQAVVEATAFDPVLLNGLLYFDYACAAQQAGRYVKAAELFRKSIELDPKNPDAYNALGYMWVERKENLDEAEQLIRKALTFEPENGAYIDSLGWLHYQRGNFDLALTELLRASKTLPQPDAAVLEHIGDTYRALNRTAEALLYWQKSSQLDPANKAIAAKIDTAAEKVAQKPQ